jgi:hypothetical protein
MATIAGCMPLFEAYIIASIYYILIIGLHIA